MKWNRDEAPLLLREPLWLEPLDTLEDLEADRKPTSSIESSGLTWTFNWSTSSALAIQSWILWTKSSFSTACKRSKDFRDLAMQASSWMDDKCRMCASLKFSKGTINSVNLIFTRSMFCASDNKASTSLFLTVAVERKPDLEFLRRRSLPYRAPSLRTDIVTWIPCRTNF